MSEQQTNKNWLLILLLVLAIPVALSLLLSKDVMPDFIKRTASNNYKVPKLSQQPTDTLVASDVLQIHNWQTRTGVPVYFVPTEDVPIIDLRVSFAAGSVYDADKPGLAKITADMLAEGIDDLTPDQVAKQFEQIGAEYSAKVSRERADINLRSLTDKNLSQVFTTFMKVITSPTLPATSMERLRDKMLVSIKKNQQNPHAMVIENTFKHVYQDHPYANVPWGNSESVQAMTMNDVKSFYQNFYVAENASIVIVGGIHRDRARDMAEKLASGLATGNKAPKLPQVASLEQFHKAHINFPSHQTHISLSQPGIKINDPDYFPLLVGNKILGSGFTSRLVKTIRVDNGLAYSVGSYLSPMQDRGLFSIMLQTKADNYKDAIDLVNTTLEQFIEDGPSDVELADAIENLTGSFPLNFDSNKRILNEVTEMAFYKLPFNYLDNYVNSIRKVTKEDIISAFKQQINTNKMALVTVGGES